MTDYLNPHRIYPAVDHPTGNDSIRKRLPEVNLRGGAMSKEELWAYADRAAQVHGREPIRMDILLDGDYVEIHYTFEPIPFERIRRITGYLQKTTAWNDGKTAELKDRTKHVGWVNQCEICGWELPEGDMTCRQCQKKWGGET